LRGVGLGDRSDLETFTLTGPPTAVREIIQSATGAALAPGGVVWSRAARWCGAGGGRVFVIVDPSASDRPLNRISLRVRLRADLKVADVSDAWTAIAVVGARCEELLARVALGDRTSEPRAPFAPATIARSTCFVLRESRREALIIAPTAHGMDVWRQCLEDGYPMGLSIVGIEALERFALHERLTHRAALQLPPIPA
jgi:glycine cleavage system aminomethyltransferase T